MKMAFILEANRLAFLAPNSKPTLRSPSSSRLVHREHLPKHLVYRSDKSLLEVLNTSSKDEVEKRYSDRPSVSGRLRKSLFKAALIETLGLMKNDNEIWTLGKQNQK